MTLLPLFLLQLCRGPRSCPVQSTACRRLRDWGRCGRSEARGANAPSKLLPPVAQRSAARAVGVPVGRVAPAPSLLPVAGVPAGASLT